MNHTKDIHDLFTEIYQKFMSETEDYHIKNHSHEEANEYEFFSSLNEKQKKLYLGVVKRISFEAVTTILNLIDETEGLEVTYNQEKIENITEEFLIGYSNTEEPNPPATGFVF